MAQGSGAIWIGSSLPLACSIARTFHCEIAAHRTLHRRWRWCWDEVKKKLTATIVNLERSCEQNSRNLEIAQEMPADSRLGDVQEVLGAR
jgi:hypothetical protein